MDKKALSEYYVECNALLSDKWTWSEDDQQIIKQYSQRVKNAKSIISDFINDKDKWRVVIGATFGIGKTSLVTTIASKLASNFLDEYQNEDNYIPVIVFLRNGLDNIYKQYSLYNVLDNISPLSEINSNKKRILLILDGLDEYIDQKQLMQEVRDRFHRNYPNMKILLTTRLIPELPDVLNFDEYIRLLQFTRIQVDEFFQRYNVTLSYDDIIYLGINHNEICTPLFCWMLALMHSDSEIKIELKPNWTTRMRKTFLYMFFFYFIIKGKYKNSLNNNSWKAEYISEKKILRIIAAISHIYRERLSVEMIRRKLENFQINDIYFSETNVIDKLEPLLTSYFYLHFSIKGKIVDFIHLTFKEYLLAEYYLENMLENKLYRLNVGFPQNDTILFLDGLIDILKEAERDDMLAKYVSHSETSLLNSLNYNKGITSALKDLRQTAKHGLNEENIILLKSSDTNNNDFQVHNMWKQIDISNSDFEDSWLHKWIMLFINRKLKDDQKLDKNKLCKLLRYSSNLIPTYLRFLPEVDLSNSNLLGTNLRFANLSKANLSKANLQSADLSGANLSGADLSNADISYCDLVGSNLSKANLYQVNLEGSILMYVNFSNANLSGSNLQLTNIYQANFSNCVLIGMKFIVRWLSWVQYQWVLYLNILFCSHCQQTLATQ